MAEARSKQRYDWRRQLMRTKSAIEAQRLRRLIDASLREENELIAALNKRNKVCPSGGHIESYLSSKY